VVGTGRYLSPEQAAAVYDRVGRWQDTQSFYERPAVDELIRAGQFEVATSVVEVGCGTGALAARLLDAHLPATARYVALEVSATMVGLTQRRLRVGPTESGSNGSTGTARGRHLTRVRTG
jgi:ubiquinone/menaquinone biosynthesis C-methylase UbiE